MGYRATKHRGRSRSTRTSDEEKNAAVIVGFAALVDVASGLYPEIHLPIFEADDLALMPGITSLFGDDLNNEQAELLNRRLGQAIQNELKLRSAELTARDVDELREGLTLDDTDCILAGIPGHADEDKFAHTVATADVHTSVEGGCALLRSLHRHLDELLNAAAGPMRNLADLASRIKVTCISDSEPGIAVDYCESMRAKHGWLKPQTYEVRLSHAFANVLLGAAKVTAARVWFEETNEDERATLREKNTAKKLNDILRRSLSRLIEPRPGSLSDDLAESLLPYQLIVGDALFHGMLMFTLAHEVAHIVQWDAPRKSFDHLDHPPASIFELLETVQWPKSLRETCANELLIDMIALKLLGLVVNLQNTERPSMKPLWNYVWGLGVQRCSSQFGE